MHCTLCSNLDQMYFVVEASVTLRRSLERDLLAGTVSKVSAVILLDALLYNPLDKSER